MSYGLIMADVRRGLFDERNLDLVGFCNVLNIDPWLILPKGAYNVREAYFKRIIQVEMGEEEFINPLNAVITVKKVIEKFGDPFALIFSASSSGMEIAPYVAGYLKSPIITDVSGYQKESGTLLKSLYSDKVFASLKIKGEGFFVITVRSGSFRHEAREIEENTIYEKLEGLTRDERRRFLGYIEEEKQEVDITKADFLLSIGRGVGTKDEIPLYEELASLLGATISGSRPVIDKKWLPKSRQVGTSGKTVKPKVYLAMGISGAFQHVSGMKDSECIIAVNKDPEAPIFQYAHYGIIADMHKIRDRLIQILREK